MDSVKNGRGVCDVDDPPAERSEAVAAICRLLLSEADLEELCDQAAAILSDRFAFPVVAVALLVSGRDEVVFVGSFGLPTNGERLRMPASETVVGAVALGGEPEVWSGVGAREDARFTQLKVHGLDTVVAVPIRAGGELLGALALADRSPRVDAPALVDALEPAAGALGEVIARSRAEAELAASRRTLTTLFSNLPGMAYRCRNDHDWTMEVVSEGAEALTGYPAAELVSGRVRYGDLIHPDDAQYVWDEVQRALAAGEPFTLSYRIRTADGRERSVWEQGREVAGGEGEVSRLEGFITDVSERVRAEADLRALAADLERRVARRTADLETLYQLSQRLATAIRPAEVADALLAELEAAVGSDVAGLALVTDSTAELRLRPRRPLTAGVEQELRFRLRDRLGRLLERELSVEVVPTPAASEEGDALEKLAGVVEVPLLGGDGPVGLLLLAAGGEPLDPAEVRLVYTAANQAAAVLERLRALAAAEEARLQSVLEHLPDGVVVIDAAGLVHSANAAGRRLLGRLGVPEAGAVEHLSDLPLSDLLAYAGAELPLELEMEGPDQVCAVAAHRLSAPAEERWLLVLRDVSRLRAVDREVARHDRLASVSRLAAGIAHDFNNILQSIMMQAELTDLHCRGDEVVEEKMAEIVEQGRRGAGVVRRILDFSTQSRGARVELDLRRVVEDVLDAERERLPDRVELRAELPDEPLLVSGDPAQLAQVLGNLIRNAAEAVAEDGCIAVRAAVETVAPGERPPLLGVRPGRWIRAEVSDTGPGIDPGVRSRVFEPFVTTKSPAESAGLGLAQAYGLVRQHGGMIGCDSGDDGTTFRVYLPAAGADVEPEPELEPGRTILVVEDETRVLEVARDLLKALGYRVLTAASGAEALAVYSRHRGDVDTVLTDMVMPGMSGGELARRVRDLDSDIRIIVMSGYPLADRMEELERVGIGAWLTKPFTRDQLARVLAPGR